MKFFNLSFLYLVFGRAVTIYDLHQIYNLCLLGIYMVENNYITFSGILSNDKRYTQLMEGDSSKTMFNIEQTSVLENPQLFLRARAGAGAKSQIFCGCGRARA